MRHHPLEEAITLPPSACLRSCVILLLFWLDRQGCAARSLVPTVVPGVKLDVSPDRAPRGSTVSLFCDWATETKPGDTVTRWEKDSSPIPTGNPRFNVRRHNAGSVLQIIGLRDNDAGNFTCIRSAGGGNVAFSDSKTLTVIGPPKIHQTRDDVAPVGGSATLQCLCDNCLFVQWEHRKFRVEDDPRFGQEAMGAILTISSVNVSDRGRYTCTAYNERFQSKQRVHLAVKRKPLITIHPNTTLISPGDTVILLCKTESFPPATIHWLHNGKEVDYDRRTSLPVHNSANLQIRNAKLSDSGNYTCTAKNSLGSVSSHQASLIVKVPLQKVKVGRQKAMYNDTVVLTCPRDNADGKIKVWWTVRNHRVDSELMPRYKELHNGSLRISGVQYDDALETISCAMQQDDGNSTLIAIARMQLEVNEPIEIEGRIAMQQTAEFAVCVKWNTSSPVFILDTISRLKVIVRSVAGDLYRTVMVDGNDRNVSMINVPEDDSYRVQIDVIMTDGRYVPGKEKILPLMRLNSTARPATETTTAETPTVNAEPRTTTFLVDNETLSTIATAPMRLQRTQRGGNSEIDLAYGLGILLGTVIAAFIVLAVWLLCCKLLKTKSPENKETLKKSSSEKDSTENNETPEKCSTESKETPEKESTESEETPEKESPSSEKDKTENKEIPDKGSSD